MGFAVLAQVDESGIELVFGMALAAWAVHIVHMVRDLWRLAAVFGCTLTIEVFVFLRSALMCYVWVEHLCSCVCFSFDVTVVW